MAALRRLRERLRLWGELAPEVAAADVLRLLILSLPPERRTSRRSPRR